jgi:hypothetical protein
VTSISEKGLVKLGDGMASAFTFPFEFREDGVNASMNAGKLSIAGRDEI